MDVIDRQLAAATTKTLVPPGPTLTPKQAQKTVQGLHVAATKSVEHVLELTQLDVSQRLADSEVLVVDRPTWAEANLVTMPNIFYRGLAATAETEPQVAKMLNSQLSQKASGVQVGAVMAFLATRVLGQFDPYTSLENPNTGEPLGPAGGRLLLVAPNVVKVGQEIKARPRDFRLWVCLHEQTHRVQFNAAPWLQKYVLDKVSELITSAVAYQGKFAAESLAGAELSPQLHEITAVMSFLEGHANHIMDAVDSRIIPTVGAIRRRFNERSKSDGLLTKLIKQVIGMDLKAQQYVQGQKFVDHAVQHLGMEGFNQVFAGPEMLPSYQELLNPDTWVARVRKS